MATMPALFSPEHSGACPGLPTMAPIASSGKAVSGDTKDNARAIKDKIFVTFLKKASKLKDCLGEGFEKSLLILSLPRKDRVRLRSTNSQAQLNEELLRREHLIRILPNEE